MKSIFTFFLIAVSFLSYAQTAEQREVIRASMNQGIVARSTNKIKSFSLEKEKRIEAFLKENPDKQRTFTKDGKVYFLYFITKEGKPRYITTKDIYQAENTKAIELYSGGSIGVNITGTNMVAGVWDGGQVNENHELLVGKVEMQPDQTYSEPAGNNHQTAVTGIMVGRIITGTGSTAHGIAHNATTLNYDWDDDLLEMNAFANLNFKSLLWLRQ